MTHRELPDAGQIPHHALDHLYYLVTQGQIRLAVCTADVSNPPTGTELDAIFGAPAEAGAGFLALLNDAGAGTNLYLVATDGANWWTFVGTKAV